MGNMQLIMDIVDGRGGEASFYSEEVETKVSFSYPRALGFPFAFDLTLHFHSSWFAFALEERWLSCKMDFEP